MKNSRKSILKSAVAAACLIGIATPTAVFAYSYPPRECSVWASLAQFFFGGDGTCGYR
jgi:hypothetical protein